VVDVATSLLDHLVTSDRELLTVLVGDRALDADTDAIVAWVAAARPRVEVEVHRGDQPVYPYLFGAE
jgi:dihydroxyacetone kinase-like predicted kinase